MFVQGLELLGRMRIGSEAPTLRMRIDGVVSQLDEKAELFLARFSYEGRKIACSSRSGVV